MKVLAEMLALLFFTQKTYEFYTLSNNVVRLAKTT